MNIEVVASINLEDFALAIARSRDHDTIQGFVQAIDDYVCDLEFTKALRDRLTEVIDREEED